MRYVRTLGLACAMLVLGFLIYRGASTSPFVIFGVDRLASLAQVILSVTVINPNVPEPTPQPKPIASAGGGGGGGGGAIAQSAQGASVMFTGRAYPNSTVVLLKDGQIAISAHAGGDARFTLALSGLTPGSYIFSLYGVDNDGIRSPTTPYQTLLTAGASTVINGIFISPTLAMDKRAVRRGDNVQFFGRSAASSMVTISIHSSPEIFVHAEAGQDGAYIYTFDTSVLEYGNHLAKSKAVLTSEASAFGQAVPFDVGDKSVQVDSKSKRGDLNGDGKVDLVDFSVMAYWYQRTLSGKGSEADLNQDGRVDLIDFSILMYHWTG